MTTQNISIHLDNELMMGGRRVPPAILTLKYQFDMNSI
jgi:hypothetical protein